MSGTCYYCNKEYEKISMKRHLNACKERKVKCERGGGENTGNYYMIEINDRFRKSDYWLYIACHEELNLKDIDIFLRTVWLECCGHLSQFTIDGQRFSCDADMAISLEELYPGEDPQAVDIKLKDIFHIGSKFKYEYDFGSTTELEGKIVDYFKYSTLGNKIEIMARHNNLEYACFKCNKIASYVNEFGEYICEECGEDEIYEEEWLREVGDMSSPRSGVCGYCGTREAEEEYLPK